MGTGKTLRTALALLLLALPALAAPPSDQELVAELQSQAAKQGIPVEILAAVAQQSSGMKQFLPSGQPRVTPWGTMGIMGISTATARDLGLDIERLKTDFRYNIESGARILKIKDAAAHRLLTANSDLRPDKSPVGDKKLLENWYYAINLYGGYTASNNPQTEGRAGKTFQDRVLDHIAQPTGLMKTIVPKPIKVTRPHDAIPDYAHGEYYRALIVKVQETEEGQVIDGWGTAHPAEIHRGQDVVVRWSVQGVELDAPRSGLNPTPAEILAYMQEISAKKQIPIEILAAIAEKESNWRQYNSRGRPLIGFTGDLGIMQVNPGTAREYKLNIERLKTDWKYNLDKATDILNDKFESAHYVRTRASGLDPDTTPRADRSLLENWYYPLNFYNGDALSNNPDVRGQRGKTYQERVFNIINNRIGNQKILPDRGLKVRTPHAAIPGFYHGQYFRAEATEDGQGRYTHRARGQDKVLTAPITRGSFGTAVPAARGIIDALKETGPK